MKQYAIKTTTFENALGTSTQATVLLDGVIYGNFWAGDAYKKAKWLVKALEQKDIAAIRCYIQTLQEQVVSFEEAYYEEAHCGDLEDAGQWLVGIAGFEANIKTLSDWIDGLEQ